MFKKVTEETVSTIRPELNESETTYYILGIPIYRQVLRRLLQGERVAQNGKMKAWGRIPITEELEPTETLDILNNDESNGILSKIKESRRDFSTEEWVQIPKAKTYSDMVIDFQKKNKRHYGDNLKELLFVVEEKHPIAVMRDGDMWIENPKSGFIPKEEWDAFNKAEKALNGLSDVTDDTFNGLGDCFAYKRDETGEVVCFRSITLLIQKKDGDPVYEGFAVEIGKTKFKEIEIRHE